ncbi:MAG: HIT family protein [Nanoarchaeota archaeon]|nr:HIT family protein [Nanoarchaeota archaeon]
MTESTNCEYCSIIKEKRNKIYEDELVYAFAAEKPATAGHVIIIPKKHHPIFEEVPEKVAGHLFLIANKISVAVFESLGAHGTNIIANNGIAGGQEIPHFSLHVLPRRENDGLHLEWKPKQLSDDEMGTAELLIKENSKKVGIFEEEKRPPMELKEGPKEKIEEKTVEGKKKENYLVKQLRRIS